MVTLRHHLKRLSLAGAVLFVIALAPTVAIAAGQTPGPQPAPGAGQSSPAASGSLSFADWRSSNWDALSGRVHLVRTWTIHYRAHNGASRIALVVLPSWYGPRNNPPIPLVISPHGRGVEPEANAEMWGNIPALGSFAVVNPEGQGDRLELFSWGSPGQISDLARMPAIVRHALPWLQIAPHRVYAIGGSMGGQETLLLLAKHPHMLAGAISFDAPTNMAARYSAFRKLPYGLNLQQLARLEFGGIPRARGDIWADRSPIFYSREIAFSGVPLQIWWSTQDEIVRDQASESGLLYRAIKRLNPQAPVVQYVGAWLHTLEMRPIALMPVALADMGLLQFAPPAPVLA
jgi:pimeloyl-ACP methyl ester carboxylesterase